MDAEISVLTNMIARGWENFLARPTGSLNLRFILQPTIASCLALRAGINDAREGRPAYLWAALTNPGHRWRLLHGGWKDMRTPFLVAATLDAIYQIIIHKFIYPLELLFTATLLALVPYFILRGPVNRIARGITSNPIIGNHDGSLEFKIPKRPIRRKIIGLPAFTTVRGGAYFFLPGIKALRYLATPTDSRQAPVQ